MISHIIDPIAFEQCGREVDSTDDLLHRIEKINERIVKGDFSTETVNNETVQTATKEPKN